jgi:hypothetical protein
MLPRTGTVTVYVDPSVPTNVNGACPSIRVVPLVASMTIYTPVIVSPDRSAALTINSEASSAVCDSVSAIGATRNNAPSANDRMYR